jgi:hypothetical protein
MTLNRDQLIKLLNLTGSEYDAEVLNAIRRANALLRQLCLPKTLSTRWLPVRSGNVGEWFRSLACCCMYWLRLSSRRRGWRPRSSSCAIN